MMISQGDIRSVFESLVTSVYGGVFFMLFGAAILIWSVKKPTRKFQIRGLIGAFISMLLGIWIIYKSFF